VLRRARAEHRPAARLDVADLVRAGRRERLVSDVASARGALRRCATHPVARLIALGALLVAASTLVERTTGTPSGAADEPARAVRAPVEVSALRAAALERGFAERWGRAPSAAERSALLEQDALDEILYREARLLGLDIDDASVRRRLVESMRALGETPARDEDALVRAALELGLGDDVVIRRLLTTKMRLVLQRDPAPVAVDDAALAALLERRRGELEQPETITLAQVLVATEAASAHEADRRANEMLRALRAGELSPEDAARASDPLPHGGTLRAQPRLKVQARFGKDFADRVFTLPEGAWSGPIASPYGLHLVRVERRDPARVPTLDELRPTLVEGLRRERAQQNLARGLRRLRALYEVRVEETPTGTTTSALRHAPSAS